MKATSHGADDLQDVLQEFIEAVERPDAATLDEFVRKYPHYAAELTDFAAEWLLEELSPSEVLSSDEQHAAVSHAMSYLQNRLYEMERTRTEQGGDPTKVAPLFAQWTPTEFKCLADALGVKKPEVAKIRDRKIEADTIPIEFTEIISAEAGVPVDVVNAYLKQPAVVPQRADFKTSGKPEAGKKESFRDAIEHSTMSDSQKAKWLAKLK